MAKDWDVVEKGGVSQKIEELADRYGKLRRRDRRSIIVAAATTLAAAIWMGGLAPALKAYQSGHAAETRAEKHREATLAAAVPIPDANAKIQEEAKTLATMAEAAEAAAEAKRRASGAGPDLPAMVGKAAGADLAGVAADGGKWPVESEDGRWVHRIEARAVSADWEALSTAMKRAEAAAGPTAKILALDVGAMDDGRIAARAEWAVIGPDRDWVGKRAAPTEGAGSGK